MIEYLDGIDGFLIVVVFAVLYVIADIVKIAIDEGDRRDENLSGKN